MKNNIRRFAILILGLMVVLHFSVLALAQEGKKKHKILYYRNPMNPSVTSEVPAKDPMGMDYIPVYEEEDAPAAGAESEAANIVKLNERDISLAGVVSEPVAVRHLFKEIRTVGRVAYDPELYKAEEELLQAFGMRKSLEKSEIPEIKERADALVEAAKLKLRLMGLEQEQIEEVSLQKEPDRSLIISDKENPYVWVYADIYEFELSWVKVGQSVKVEAISFPGEEFSGEVSAIDPVLNPMTRSARIRVRIGNPELKLKPQMYTDIFIEAYLVDKKGEHRSALAIPVDAVLDTGMRKLVYLDLGKGSYLGKEVKSGPRATAYVDGQKRDFYPIEAGLKEGDKVVIKANFLIDSQSQLSGVAASAYSGALGAQEEIVPAAAHQH
ncbi:MAG: efflux RND transporter periplasmic adaptor subunit [Candidatus Omnitrophota bacterium]